MKIEKKINIITNTIQRKEGGTFKTFRTHVDNLAGCYKENQEDLIKIVNDLKWINVRFVDSTPSFSSGDGLYRVEFTNGEIWLDDRKYRETNDPYKLVARIRSTASLSQFKRTLESKKESK